jgi:heat-inducible transcriptional repressor
MSHLEKRSEIILKAIVTEYISTGEPVGSRTVSKIKSIGLSAASIRNIMSDLTDSGYITQPHVSAGRIPTDLGYRFYVDSFVHLEHVPMSEYWAIEASLKPAGNDIREILKKSSWVLADFSKQAGVVAATPMVEQAFKAIEFIKMSENRILVVLVSAGGFVQSKVILDDNDFDQETLEKYARMINDLLKDLDLDQARERIEQELTKEKTQFDDMLSRALKLSHSILTSNHSREVYIEGQTNILEEPEFNRIEKIKALLVTFEDKSNLLRLLDKTLKADGIRVFIGSEHGIDEIEPCSVITYPIRTTESVLGTLAVIGPKRMNYIKLIPLVQATAVVLNSHLKEVIESES